MDILQNTLNIIKSSLSRPYSVLQSKLVLNAGYLWGTTVIGGITGYIFWVIAARFTSTAQVGLSSTAISTIQLLATIACLGLGSGLIRFIPDNDNKGQLINTVLSLVVITSLITGIIYFSGAKYWTPGLVPLTQLPLAMICFLLVIVFISINIILQFTFLGFRQASYSFWLQVILHSLRLATVVISARFGAWGIIGALAAGMLISDFVSIKYFLPLVHHNYRFSISFQYTDKNDLISYSFLNYLADLLSRLPVLLAPVLALSQFGPSFSAYAYVAWMIGSVISGPGLAFAQSAFAEGSHLPKELTHIFSRATIISIAVTIPITIIVFLGSKLVLSPFGSFYQSESFTLLRWLTLAAPFAAVNGIFFSVLRIVKKLSLLIAFNFIVCFFSIGAGVINIGASGIVSMGIGWFSGQVVVLFLASIWILGSFKKQVLLTIS